MGSLSDIEIKLASTDEEERRLAISALAAFPFEQVKSIAFSALGDESWRVRKEAVDLILSASPTEELARELLELLSVHGNAGLRNSVVEVLQSIGDPVLPQIVSYIAHEDSGVRKFIVDIIGGIGSPAGIHDLKAVLHDSDPNVAAAAAESMGLIGHADALPSLLEALKRDELLIRYAILEALVKIGNPVPLDSITELAGDPLLKKAVFECLGVIGDITSVHLLVDGLRSRARNVREAALSALSVIRQRCPLSQFDDMAKADLKSFCGTEALDYLIASRDSSDPRVRGAATLFLGLVGDPRVVEVILQGYKDEELRQASLDALRCFGEAAGTRMLELFASSDEEMRCIIVHIAGEIKFGQSSDIASAALGDSSAMVRALAAESIGKSGNTELIPRLIDLTCDENVEVRKRATTALVRLAKSASTGVESAARQLVDSADPDYRLLAVRLFAALHDVQSLIALSKDEDYLVRRESINALGELRIPDSAGRITMALADEEADVRLAAANALGWDGFVDEANSLILLLDDSSQRVQAAAVKSLGKRREITSFGRIADLAKNSTGILRITALQSLAQIDPKQAMDILAAGQSDADEEVAKVASNLLRDLSEGH